MTFRYMNAAPRDGVFLSHLPAGVCIYFFRNFFHDGIHLVVGKRSLVGLKYQAICVGVLPSFVNVSNNSGPRTTRSPIFSCITFKTCKLSVFSGTQMAISRGMNGNNDHILNLNFTSSCFERSVSVSGEIFLQNSSRLISFISFYWHSNMYLFALFLNIVPISKIFTSFKSNSAAFA